MFTGDLGKLPIIKDIYVNLSEPTLSKHIVSITTEVPTRKRARTEDVSNDVSLKHYLSQNKKNPTSNLFHDNQKLISFLMAKLHDCEPIEQLQKEDRYYEQIDKK